MSFRFLPPVAAGFLLLCAGLFIHPNPEHSSAEQTIGGATRHGGGDKSHIPQPRLPIALLDVAGVALGAEVADSNLERSVGLMGRGSIADGEGMLFVFPEQGPLEFWMKDTHLPLSIAYLDKAGRIAEIHDLAPRSETLVASKARNLTYALEVPKGWFSRKGIKEGMTVSNLPPAETAEPEPR